MTDRLEEIKARAAVATAGPWHLNKEGLGNGYDSPTVYATDTDLRYIAVCRDYLTTTPTPNEANASFISHARADIPWLVEQVESLRSCLRDVLRFAKAANEGFPEGDPSFDRADAILDGQTDTLRTIVDAAADAVIVWGGESTGEQLDEAMRRLSDLIVGRPDPLRQTIEEQQQIIDTLHETTKNRIEELATLRASLSDTIRERDAYYDELTSLRRLWAAVEDEDQYDRFAVFAGEDSTGESCVRMESMRRYRAALLAAMKGRAK
jgi:PAS domain-containing protein